MRLHGFTHPTSPVLTGISGSLRSAPGASILSCFRWSSVFSVASRTSSLFSPAIHFPGSRRGRSARSFGNTGSPTGKRRASKVSGGAGSGSDCMRQRSSVRPTGKSSFSSGLVPQRLRLTLDARGLLSHTNQTTSCKRSKFRRRFALPKGSRTNVPSRKNLRSKIFGPTAP
jgi:hypothetical protein